MKPVRERLNSLIERGERLHQNLGQCTFTTVPVIDYQARAEILDGWRGLRSRRLGETALREGIWSVIGDAYTRSFVRSSDDHAYPTTLDESYLSLVCSSELRPQRKTNIYRN